MPIFFAHAPQRSLHELFTTRAQPSASAQTHSFRATAEKQRKYTAANAHRSLEQAAPLRLNCGRPTCIRKRARTPARTHAPRASISQLMCSALPDARRRPVVDDLIYARRTDTHTRITPRASANKLHSTRAQSVFATIHLPHPAKCAQREFFRIEFLMVTYAQLVVRATPMRADRFSQPELEPAPVDQPTATACKTIGVARRRMPDVDGRRSSTRRSSDNTQRSHQQLYYANVCVSICRTTLHATSHFTLMSSQWSVFLYTSVVERWAK